MSFSQYVDTADEFGVDSEWRIHRELDRTFNTSALGRLPPLHDSYILAHFARALDGCLVSFGHVNLVEKQIDLLHLMHLTSHFFSEGVETKRERDYKIILGAPVVWAVLANDLDE